MTMRGSGYLAIWSDLAPEDETDWAHWITREHAAERVGIRGFLACRIFRALGIAANRYFILYELDQPEVVGSPPYLARLNEPTAWSQAIMPRLRNFARGGGRIIAAAGSGQGGVVAVLRLEREPEWTPDTVCRKLASMDRIVAARVLMTDSSRTSIQTREKSLRAADDSFAGLLVIEGLDEPSLRNALGELQTHAPQIDIAAAEAPPLYRLFFSLQKGD